MARNRSVSENSTMNYVVQVDSPVHYALNGGGQMGVKELARIFSARGKEQALSMDASKRSPVTSNKQQVSNRKASQNRVSDPRYQNVFDDPKFVKKTVSDASTHQMKAKKPIPTPRKLCSSQELPVTNDSSDDEDGYTPMSTTIDELRNLKSEIDLLESVADLPPLHTDKHEDGIQQKDKDVFSKSLSPVKLGFVSPTERKKVLDAGSGSNGVKSHVTIGFSIGELSDGEEEALYLPVLPETKRYMNGFSNGRGGKTNGTVSKDVIHRRLTTEDNVRQKGNNWKRTQGSIFAEEMIDMMSTDDDYYPIPNIHDKDKVRQSSHSYMEIDENRLRHLPVGMLPNGSSEPVYIQAEEGCEDEYVSPSHFIGNRVDPLVACPISPPIVFPKSMSLLREQEECSIDYISRDFDSRVPIQSIPAVEMQQKQMKKPGKLKNVLKTQPFTTNKRKKNKLAPVISSPRLPLYPPNNKRIQLDGVDGSLCSSESDIHEPLHQKLSLSSLSPSPLTPTSPLDSLSESHSTPSQSPLLQRTCSDIAMNKINIHRRSSTMSTCSNPEISQEKSETNNETPVRIITTARQNRPVTPKARGLEESGSGSNSVESKRVFGYFTYQGGTLSSRESSAHVVIPQGAVPKGKRQKLWFEVLQTLCKEGQESFADSIAFSSSREVESNPNQAKKENAVQLSLTVLIGPSDVVLNKPIKVFIPHCASTTDNTVWKLKVIGRASQSEDWEMLIPSGTHFKPNMTKQKKYKNSTYKIYPDHFRVKTRHVGCFRMTGKPVGQNLAKIKKMMVSSVYCQMVDDNIRVKVFVTNLFLDSVETLYNLMLSEGYTCIERNIPTVCSGDHSDLKVSLMIETNQGKVATYMQVIPFEMFWRVTRVGKSVAMFDLSKDELANSKVLKIELDQREESQMFEVLLPY